MATTEELACKVTPNGARSVRTFALKDLETLCSRIRKAGGKPGTSVKVVRESATGDIRLVANIGK